jgi:curli biogenesis system outer membrane secretion channel CsgG
MKTISLNRIGNGRAWMIALALPLAGCMATTPTSGGGSISPVKGAAAGATAAGADSGLERCPTTLGTLRIDEDRSAAWYGHYGSRLGSTAPLLSTMIMQSNCFVIVERGSGERAMNDETARARGDEARESATRGKGQQVVADYLMKPEIVMGKEATSGGGLGGIGRLGGLAGFVAGNVGFKSNEASTVLTLVDIRSTARIAAAEGYSKNSEFTLAGFGIGGMGVGKANAWGSTPEGKLIAAAFADAYNKMVVALRQYKAQTVEGGLGEGGTLGVQGGGTAAGKKVK